MVYTELEIKKFNLRKEMRQKRQDEDPLDIFSKSMKIIENLIKVEECKGPKKIMFYLSYGSEAMTFDTINLANMTKMEVYVPYLVEKDMKISRLRNLSELSMTEYGIMEPEKREDISKEDLEIVIVPGVVFDRKGNRIGSGLGYYDRFLKDTKAIKIALAFDFQVIDKIEPTKEDIPVDIIITEKEVIRCK